MKRLAVTVFFLLVLLGFGAKSFFVDYALAADSPPAAEDTESKLRSIEAEQAAKAARKNEAHKNAANAAHDLASMNTQLVALASDERKLEDDVDDLTDQLSDLNRDSADQTQAWKLAQADYVTLWRALIRFSQTPDMTLLGVPGNPLDAARGLQIMQDLLARLQARAKQLQAQYADMIATRRTLEQKQQNLEQQKKRLQDHQADLRQLMDERNKMLAAATDEEKELAAQLAVLAKQANSLQQLLAGVSARNVIITPEQKIGDLILPVAGPLTQRFKQRDEYGVVSEGITFAGAANAVIVAPLAGKVVFAGPFKGYGNLVILEHAGGWHSLVAGFGRIDARLGTIVSQGEPLGLLPESAQSGRVSLYFELRHGDEPVDPLIAARQKKIRPRDVHHHTTQ